MVRDHRDHGIKHVFVLVLENRSFDHMLGRSGLTGIDARTHQPTTIVGLRGDETNAYAGHTYRVAAGAPDTMEHGPGHDFADVLEQLCGPGATYPAHGPYPPITCGGYASSYGRGQGVAHAGDPLRGFAPDELPVLHALAREFAVCDHWFSSLPGPTQPNRMFFHAATSSTLLHGCYDDAPSGGTEGLGQLGLGYNFPAGTVFSRLSRADIKFRIYCGDWLPNVAELNDVDPWHLHSFDDFAEDLRDPHFDAGYVFIEPKYDAVFGGFAGGNSQHPKGSVAAGEWLIKRTYEAIRASPLWPQSLLIVTWDEHGGFYDHVPPPSAPSDGERGKRHGFDFHVYGPRVPAVVVSPRIPRGLIEHRTMDHCAVPATVLRTFNLDGLRVRDKTGNGVNHLAYLSTPRADTPRELPTPRGAEHIDRVVDAGPVDPGWQAATVHAAAVQHAKAAPEHRDAIVARVQAIRSRDDAASYLREALPIITARRRPATVR